MSKFNSVYYCTDPEELRILADNSQWYIRRTVALNLNTPTDILELLATDENYIVRYRVAENKNTPIETLQLLATDENYVVRYYVGRNPNSTELVKRLVLMTNAHRHKQSLSDTT
jgi:hypothetical protein